MFAGLNLKSLVSEDIFLNIQVHKTRVNPKEILKEVPAMLQQLETAVAKQEIIIKLQQENPPGKDKQCYTPQTEI